MRRRNAAISASAKPLGSSVIQAEWTQSISPITPSAAKRLTIATKSVIPAARCSRNIGNSTSPSAGIRLRSSDSPLDHSR